MNAISNPEKLRSFCMQAQSILLTGPIYPDGDSLGACLALRYGLQQLSQARIDVAGDISFRYQGMPCSNEILPDNAIQGPYDLAIVLDGDRHRLTPPIHQAYNSAQTKGIIDHHSSTNIQGYDIAILDSAAASTCEMALNILEGWGIGLDSTLANPC